MPKTSIAWCDFSWPVINGCQRKSAGCQSCYAERLAATRLKHTNRYRGLATMTEHGPRWTGESRLDLVELAKPLRMRKPQRIFVCEMGDLFYEGNTNEQIAAVFGVMAACPQHTFQVLTKRPERMREWFQWVEKRAADGLAMFPHDDREWRIRQMLEVSARRSGAGPQTHHGGPWPLPNVWLGVSCENQRAADERIPLLLQCPAAVRFVSCEPLLGQIDFRAALDRDYPKDWGGDSDAEINWVIVGGESGPKARPMHPDWPRSILRQCRDAGVPAFFKQRGSWLAQSWGARAENGQQWGTLTAAGEWYPSATPWNGRRLDDSPDREEIMVHTGGKGGDPSEWPSDLRVREFPEPRHA